MCPQSVELDRRGRLAQHNNHGSPCPGSGALPKGAHRKARNLRKRKDRD